MLWLNHEHGKGLVVGFGMVDHVFLLTWPLSHMPPRLSEPKLSEECCDERGFWQERWDPDHKLWFESKSQQLLGLFSVKVLRFFNKTPYKVYNSAREQNKELLCEAHPQDFEVHLPFWEKDPNSSFDSYHVVMQSPATRSVAAKTLCLFPLCSDHTLPETVPVPLQYFLKWPPVQRACGMRTCNANVP